MRRFFVIGFLLITLNALADWDEVQTIEGNRAYVCTTEKGAVIYSGKATNVKMEIVLVSNESVFNNSDNSIEVRINHNGGNTVVRKCDTYQTDESGRMCTINDSELCKEVNDCIDNNGTVEFSTKGFSMTIAKS